MHNQIFSHKKIIQGRFTILYIFIRRENIYGYDQWVDQCV